MSNNKKKKEVPFGQICPLKQVENGVLISHKGDISVIYKLRLPEVMTLTPDDYIAVQNAFSSAVNGLPNGFILQRLDFIYHTTSDIKPINNESVIEYKNLKLLNAHFATATETYFVITLTESSAKQTFTKSWFEVFYKPVNKNLIISKARVGELITRSENLISYITGSLSTKGLSAKRLNNEEINRFVMANYFSLGFYKSPLPVNCFVDYADLKDAATVGGNVIKVFSMLKDGLPESVSNVKIEGNYHKKGVSELPVSYLHDLSFNLSFPHIINQVLYSVDNTNLYSTLKRKRNLLKGMAWANSSNARNAELVEDIIQNKEGGGDKLFEFHFSVIVVGPEQDRELLNLFSNEISNYFEQAGIKYSDNSYNTLRYFFSAAPGCAADIIDEHRSLLFSRQASCFQVWEDSLRSSREGVLFVDRKTNKPLRVDLWDHPQITNRNKLIVGASGTGKSFLTNKMITGFLDAGDDVFVTDMGNSYEPLIKLKNGEYIEITAEQPLRLNPFLISGKDENGYYKEPDAEIFDFITKLLFTAWQSTNKGVLTSEINSVLKLLIGGFYKHINANSIFPDYDNFYKFSVAELETNEEISKLTQQTFNKESFILVMKGFLSTEALGSFSNYGDIFNCKENTNLIDSRFVVFELKKIKDDPIRFPLAFYIIINTVSQKISPEIQARRNKRVHFFMDEVWSVLKGDYGDAVKFIEYAFRAFRKDGGSIIIISQSLSDLFSNPQIGDSIKANCDIKIFKYLDQSELNVVNRYLELNDFNKNVLFSLKDKYRDICIFFKDQPVVYRLIVDTYTEGAYSTSPNDRRWREQELLKTNGNLDLTLQNYADIKNGHTADDRSIKLLKNQ